MLYIAVSMIGRVVMAFNIVIALGFYPHYFKPTVKEMKRKRNINKIINQALNNNKKNKCNSLFEMYFGVE